MACQLPEAISKIEEILSKNGEGIASAMLSGIQINMLNEAKNNLQSVIEIRMSRMQNTTPGSESVDSTKKDFRSEFKNKRPSAAKWADKEVAKFDVATQAISDGTNNSTAGFVKDFYGDSANTGTYTKEDVVYLSTNGKRTGRVVPVKNGVLQGAYKNIDKAIEAGAKFVADTSKHLASTGNYNVGEVELAEYLQSKGYAREDKDGYGLWSSNKTSTKEENKQSHSVENKIKRSIFKISGDTYYTNNKINYRSYRIPKPNDKNMVTTRNIAQSMIKALGSELSFGNGVTDIEETYGKYNNIYTKKIKDLSVMLRDHQLNMKKMHSLKEWESIYENDVYLKNKFDSTVNELVSSLGLDKIIKSDEIDGYEFSFSSRFVEEDSQAYNPQSEPGGIDSTLKAGIDEKVRDIKISNKDLEILKKENEELTKKTGVSIKWIENDANADFNYNPDDNYVTYVEGFNDTITTVLQNHELKHALTFQYLKKNENDNKVKELIKGVNDFKDRLTELRARESKNAKKDDSESYISKTNDLYERVAYMLENSSDSKISNELRQVAEIVAILSAEKDIREQFLNEFKGDKKSKIKILIYWIKSKLNFSEVKTEYYFSPENIVKNVDKIVKQSSKEYNKDNPNIKYETISKDDIEAAKDIMSNNKKECE